MKHALCSKLVPESIDLINIDEYSIQEKKDGTRCFAIIKDGVVLELLNRRQNNPIEKYPQLAEDKFDDTYILDGEIIVETDGKSDFQALLNKENWDKAVFIVFDILSKGQFSVRHLPYRTRYAILKDIFRNHQFKHFRLIEEQDDYNKAWDWVLDTKREGLVLKKWDSMYSERRTKKWFKVKHTKQLDIIFTGFEKNPKGVTLTTTFNGVLLRVLCAGNQANSVVREIVENGTALCEINYLRLNPSGKLFQPTFSKLKKNLKIKEIVSGYDKVEVQK